MKFLRILILNNFIPSLNATEILVQIGLKTFTFVEIPDVSLRTNSLKLVSAIFFYFLKIFSPNDSPSRIIKNVFYFIKKALFILEIFKFLHFFHSLPHFPDSKGQMEVD